MEKRIVRLGGVLLGKGQCALCIPVMGESLARLRDSAEAAKAAGADILELRVDSMSAMPDVRSALDMCAAVRETAPDIPLLFTLRTKRDGGAGDADGTAYENLLLAILGGEKGLPDAVDVELSIGEEAFTRIAAAAKKAKIIVVGSSHDFETTPSEAEICARLASMQKLGADVCKIAVMPRSRLDVLALMRAAALSDEALYAPVIAIAMGRLGVMTRMGGEAFGSCLTFGTAGNASAPGQLDARELRSVLEIIHRSLS